MRSAAPEVAHRLRHPALDGSPGEPVAQARERLTDRDRVALLLEAAAVMSHTAAAGWSLAGGLAAAGVEGKRLRLRVLPTRRPEERAAVEEILAFAELLWGGSARLRGRGEARAAARRLLDRWRAAWRPPPPDRLVEDLLDGADFLWQPPFGLARESLVAEIAWTARDGEARVAGPARFARRLLTRAARESPAALLRSSACWSIWRGRAADPANADPARHALALAHAGRYEAALAIVEDATTAPALLVQARCRFELGELARAHLLLRSVERQRLASADAKVLAALRQEFGAATIASANPGTARRELSRGAAARRWRSLGLERLAASDLRGAEKAFRHAFVLESGCDPRGRERAALEGLVETLTRRGRLMVAGGWLDALEGRRAQDPESARRLRALRGRWLLAQGRCAAALDALRFDSSWSGGLGVGVEGAEGAGVSAAERGLAARALVWLGRSDEAAAELDAGGQAALAVFEPEERPAILALAGRRDEAYLAASAASAASGDSGALWRPAMVGQAPQAAQWAWLRRVERFRAARWVVDLEAVAPGIVPLYWRRRAAAHLRRAGAAALAERLEGAGQEPWRALATYLALERDAGRAEPLGDLFARAGYPEVRLWLDDAGEQRLLVAGAGGGEELAVAVGSGTLRLSAPLLDTVLRALFGVVARELLVDRPGRAVAPMPEEAPGFAGFPGLIGTSSVFQAALLRAVALAAGKLPVLIRGETGTGKELVARLVHARSPRAAAAFLPINCAALSETLVLSDLFGHVRGAFTGADRDRPGVFESARGGTVFLDEIGDLPASAQGMLLRVLQEGEVRRLGESVARRIDVRVVAATHRDLAQRVRDGAFREDLFYRLAAACVELPPLRDRGEDLWLLTADFLTAAPPAARLTAAARQRLRAHSWPGNVRELQNALAVATALAHGASIDVDHLPLPIAASGSAEARPAGYHEQVERFRRSLVASAVAAGDGNLAAAARRLGLTRQALSYLVRQLDLQRGLPEHAGQRRPVGGNHVRRS